MHLYSEALSEGIECSEKDSLAYMGSHALVPAETKQDVSLRMAGGMP